MVITVTNGVWRIKFSTIADAADFVDILPDNGEVSVEFDGLPNFPDE